MWAWFSGLFTRPRWQTAIVVFVAAAVIALFAVGPQRVLAEVQRLLRYMPGIGFVDLEQARVLPLPVEARQGSVVLRVDQVLAEADKTSLSFSTEGLTAKDLPWPNPAIDHPDFSATLRLPDGARLAATTWQLNLAAGKVEFPALPKEVDQVILEMPRLPLVPAGAAPENWQVDLHLTSASGRPLGDLFPSPYSPANASVTRDGITLEVLQVAQGPQETGLLARLSWQDPSWEHFSWSQATLSDDLGHIYWDTPGSSNAGIAIIAEPEGAAPTPTPPAHSDEHTFRLAPLSLAARRLSLALPEVSFDIPAQGSFRFDPGSDPRPGQTWKLDQSLEVAGATLHLTGARLVENPAPNPERGETPYSLEFIFEVSQPEDRQVVSIAWTADLPNFSGSGGSSNGKDRLRLTLNSNEIVRKPFTVRAERASISLPGPWEVSWDIPSSSQSGSAVRRPQVASPDQTRNGVSLHIQDILESDRVTTVRLSAAQLPAGAQLLGFHNYSSATNEHYPSLQDQWGQVIGRPQSVTWSPDGKPGNDPLQLTFAPAPALTQRLNLSVPGVELLIPGQAGFAIDVPQGLVFGPEEYTVTVAGGGGPERQETRTRLASRHWSVDIPVEIAGYALHFTEAWIEVNDYSDGAYVLNLRGQPVVYKQGGQALVMLRFASVARPDGQIERVSYSSDLFSLPQGGVGPESPGSSQLAAGLTLDVSTRDGFSVLPGRYQVELNGVTVWVPGPWEWSWAVSGE
jgi:hypothetical protein